MKKKKKVKICAICLMYKNSIYRQLRVSIVTGQLDNYVSNISTAYLGKLSPSSTTCSCHSTLRIKSAPLLDGVSLRSHNDFLFSLFPVESGELLVAAIWPC